MSKDGLKTFDELPKYLFVSSKRRSMQEFFLVVVKYENEGDSNAYFAMYARYSSRTCEINPHLVLFWECAPTLDLVTKKFVARYNLVKSKINGREWLGGLPIKLYLHNPIYSKNAI